MHFLLKEYRKSHNSEKNSLLIDFEILNFGLKEEGNIGLNRKNCIYANGIANRKKSFNAKFRMSKSVTSEIMMYHHIFLCTNQISPVFKFFQAHSV